MSPQQLNDFLDEQNRNMEHLYKPVLFSGWMAATTGEKEWSEKHEKALSDYFANFSDPEGFQKVLSYKKEKNLSALQSRQLEDLYHKMITNQFDSNELAKTLGLEKDISFIFDTYRPTFEGNEVTNNDLLEVFKNSKESTQRKEAWLASKQVGKRVEEPLLELVNRRNKDAQSLGFDNFYQMRFASQELDIDQVFDIFNELKLLSDDPFRQIKAEIDQEISDHLKIKIDEIRPWHYVDPFFQESPPVSGIDLDTYYKGKNLEEIAFSTFQSMGLDIEDIIQRSDLYPRENKNPFGFCTNIDREGDIRILVNLNNSLYWSTALLHEFGHAVYFKYIDKDLPFILRFHSHSLTTEAIAMFFGRMNKTWEWQERFLDLDVEQLEAVIPSIHKTLQRQLLVSVRWILTFSLFERELYENPNQDLNKRWWKLVEEIQFMTPPEDTNYPDWASKMHFSLAPASYQDYLLGELTASQLQNYIESNISQALFTPAVGEYLKEELFKPGNTMHWNEKIKSATGEYLNPSYFVNEFI